MFVFSLKTSQKQLLYGAVIIGVGLIILLVALFVPRSEAAMSSSFLNRELKTEEQRLNLLRELGYEVQEKPIEIQEIQLPDEEDDTIRSYNEVQKTMGMDLQPYYGKRIKRYAYRLLNSPLEEATVHLYIYRENLIAGDITTAEGISPLQ